MYYLKSFMSNDCHVIGRMVSADKSPSTFSGLHMLSMNNNSDQRCIPKRLEHSYSVLFFFYFGGKNTLLILILWGVFNLILVF